PRGAGGRPRRRGSRDCRLYGARRARACRRPAHRNLACGDLPSGVGPCDAHRNVEPSSYAG
ncbi:hypothetical protein QP269_25685, partial [Escherichia coli]|nr:hypothetical protein [Escherichia coli]